MLLLVYLILLKEISNYSFGNYDLPLTADLSIPRCPPTGSGGRGEVIYLELKK